MKKLKYKVKKAFSLVEILLAVSIVSMFSLVSISILQSFQFQNDVGAAVNLTAKVINSAQAYSQTQYYDSQWGVRISSASLILFKGATYASRDATQDVVFNLPSGVNVSGLSEIVFQKFTGNTSSIGIITVSKNNNSNSLVINAKGTITYN